MSAGSSLTRPTSGLSMRPAMCSGFHRDSVYKNLERYGNTSAGSIPIALDEVQVEGRLYRGDQLLLSGFGVGLSTRELLSGGGDG